MGGGGWGVAPETRAGVLAKHPLSDPDRLKKGANMWLGVPVTT